MLGIYILTKNIIEKHRYTVLNGKLCIQHYLLLQQLTYRKKLKDNSYKEYQSYHIKLPKVVKELLPANNTVFLEKVDDKLVVHTSNGDGFKKIKIQESKKGNDRGYQLTIPQKLLDMTSYQRGETYILCQVVAADNSKGFVISLNLVN